METWLSDEFFDCDFGMLRYNALRCDRSFHPFKGAGVLVGVRTDLSFQLVFITDKNILFVNYSLNEHGFLMSGVCIKCNYLSVSRNSV